MPVDKQPEPHLPKYCRKPNKLLRYELEPYDDGAGHGGQIRVAVFLDKNGKEKRTTAHYLWQYGPDIGITKEEYEKNEK